MKAVGSSSCGEESSEAVAGSSGATESCEIMNRQTSRWGSQTLGLQARRIGMISEMRQSRKRTKIGSGGEQEHDTPKSCHHDSCGSHETNQIDFNFTEPFWLVVSPFFFLSPRFLTPLTARSPDFAGCMREMYHSKSQHRCRCPTLPFADPPLEPIAVPYSLRALPHGPKES